jgi:hypothetical protein
MAVLADIEYLSRLDLYRTEKPYMTTFKIPDSVGRSTNHKYTTHKAWIQDAKSNREAFSLDIHGFEFRDWATKFQNADFEDEDTITSSYYSELLDQMERAFPHAQKIFILSHLVGKSGLLQ